ncbi:MAG: hypothetical protein KC486_18970 [Myxococcales bacterium]|nr:hypothetical protein [Myxococcales bacterium]
MSNFKIEAWIVAPVIAGSLACSITSGNTESSSATESGSDSDTDSTGTDTAATETGTETGSPDGAVTIYQIQQGEVPVDSIVKVNNVVVSTPVQADNGAVFVQEMAGGEYSGIYLYMYDEVLMGLDLAPGDVINLTGEYTEFYDFSEITVKAPEDIQIVSSGAPPTPEVVNAADIATGGAKAEAYESVLVTVQNVTVTNPDLGFGEFEVESSLHVDDFFYPNMGPSYPSGTTIDSITGAMLYNFEEFKLAPRSLDDIQGASGGTTTDTTTTDTTTTTTTGGEDLTIYDLQMGTVAPNTPVEIKDVVVTTGLTFKGDAFFVEDPAGGEYSGIYVYLQDPNGVSVKPGDVVTLTGVYDEFYDNSQIEIADASGIMVTGTDAVPAPEVVNAADVATGGAKAEAYEGVLVEIEGITVTNPDLGFGEFEVTGGLRVDDLFFAMGDWPAVSMGDAYASIIGTMNFSFDERKLSPRTIDDFAK